jgi:hypothetical protein
LINAGRGKWCLINIAKGKWCLINTGRGKWEGKHKIIKKIDLKQGVGKESAQED